MATIRTVASGNGRLKRCRIAADRYAPYIVLRYGDVYAPAFERLDKELTALRMRRTPAERARLTLEALTIDGQLA